MEKIKSFFKKWFAYFRILQVKENHQGFERMRLNKWNPLTYLFILFVYIPLGIAISIFKVFEEFIESLVYIPKLFKWQ